LFNVGIVYGEVNLCLYRWHWDFPQSFDAQWTVSIGCAFYFMTTRWASKVASHPASQNFPIDSRGVVVGLVALVLSLVLGSCSEVNHSV